MAERSASKMGEKREKSRKEAPYVSLNNEDKIRQYLYKTAQKDSNKKNTDWRQ